MKAGGGGDGEGDDGVGLPVSCFWRKGRKFNRCDGSGFFSTSLLRHLCNMSVTKMFWYVLVLVAAETMGFFVAICQRIRLCLLLKKCLVFDFGPLLINGRVEWISGFGRWLSGLRSIQINLDVKEKELCWTYNCCKMSFVFKSKALIGN